MEVLTLPYRYGHRRVWESFEEDRRRDARLGAAGYHVVRLTDPRLRGERAPR